jgi:hypothetical protein
VDARHLFEDHAGSGRGIAAALRRARRGLRSSAIDAEKLTAVIAALDGGATKAAVCRSFGSLIDSRARIGWSTGLDVEGV